MFVYGGLCNSSLARWTHRLATFTLPLRFCNSLVCGGGDLCSVHCSWPTTTFNLFSYVYHITILGAVLQGRGGACLHLHTLSYLAELSMQGLCSFFKNKYSIPIARSLCSPLLLYLDKCLSASVDHLLMETSWLYAWFTDRYSGYSGLLRVMINLYSTLVQNCNLRKFSNNKLGV